VIEKILPEAVASCEAFDDPPDAVLVPEEEAILNPAVDKRCREFPTVRHCARDAPVNCGHPIEPVLRTGSPITDPITL
jgi:enterobactin synthetase component D / holo-[acyl-carrier protein] synthase